MIVLDNGDSLRGDASVANKVDYTINGVVGATPTQLADGQLDSSEADLYPSPADSVVVLSITLVNTDTSARTVNLYLKPSGGTSRRILPKDMSLGAGYSLTFDGVDVIVLDDFGYVLTGTALHALGGSSHLPDTLANLNTKISDATLVDLAGLTATVAELNLLDLAGLTAGQLLVATGAAAAVWKSTGVKLSAPDISGIVTAAAALTLPAYTLGGAVAGGDQAFTNVGDMTFHAGSFLASGPTNGDTLLLKANDTIFITLTTGATDKMELGAFDADGVILFYAEPILRDNVDFNIGTTKDSFFRYATYDANAFSIRWGLPVVSQQANNVPVLAFGITGITTRDLGADGMDFSGRTEPLVVVVDKDFDSCVGFSFEADDDARIFIGGSAVLTMPAHTSGNLTLVSEGILNCAGIGANGWIIKNPKNSAASALSGTQLDVELDIGGVPYYFTVYPTKA